MARKKEAVSLVEIQQLAGSLNFACRCVKSGRIYLSRILNFLRITPKKGYKKLTKSVRKDLKWWQDFAPLYNGVAMITQNWWSEPDQILSTDSYLVGGGAFFEGKFLHWQFPAELKSKNLSMRYGLSTSLERNW